MISKIITEDDFCKEEFPLEYVNGKCWKDEDTTIECDMKPGEYLAYI